MSGQEKKVSLLRRSIETARFGVEATGHRIAARRWPDWGRSERFEQRLVERVREQCASLEHEATEQLRRRIGPLRDRLALPRQRRSTGLHVAAFALMTEAVRRTLGKLYYDVQLLGGLALARGSIAEMQTGEGKTITTGLPAFLLALCGRGVHVATTNAYLARRDCEELRPAFELLGLSVGLLPDEHEPHAARKAYQCDITFGTGYAFGFDFLRDQLALRQLPKLRLGTRHMARVAGRMLPGAALLQREHGYAIVDEADSVLVDEATMPLILSMPAADANAKDLLQLAADTADQLIQDEHFMINAANRSLEFTDDGWTALHMPLKRASMRGLRRPWSSYIEQALRAKHFLQRDVDYVIIDDTVQIVDQHTGRIHPERSWRDGLHQAVEVCEGVPVTPEKSSEGRVSRQRYFQFYDQLCGMTGTATGSECEFRDFYRLRVNQIATHRPCRRDYLPTRCFATDEQRNQAIVADVVARHATGQPILVGTRTIRHSKRLSQLLNEAAIPHALLNGVQDEEEARIVARAGMFHAVTIATNMAGRGTDIKPDPRALTAGGLHVVAAEHNTSRRVDRQLAGRAARQGQPGSVQFFISGEDEIFVVGESDLPSRMRAVADATGECRANLEHEVRRLQDRLERKHFQRRREMVQRDHWLESVLETLAKRNEAVDER